MKQTVEDYKKQIENLNEIDEEIEKKDYKKLLNEF